MRVRIRIRMLSLTLRLTLILTITFRIILNRRTIDISELSRLSGERYQVNKILNFPVPVSTRLLGLSGYVLLPTVQVRHVCELSGSHYMSIMLQ